MLDKKSTPIPTLIETQFATNPLWAEHDKTKESYDKANDILV